MRHSSPRLTALSLWLLGLLIAVGACQTSDHRIAGTNIPGVHGLELTSSSNVKQSGRHIAFGEFVFKGPIYDALERVRWSARGFELDGWKAVSISGRPDAATGVFTQPWPVPDMERLAKLQIVASKTEGSATLSVTLEKVPEQSDDAPVAK